MTSERYFQHPLTLTLSPAEAGEKEWDYFVSASAPKR